MTVLRMQVTLNSASGLPEDASMNVWHFHTVDADVESEANDINNIISTFYNDCSAIFSGNTLTGTCTTKFFDLSDDPPRVPFFSDGFAITSMGDADALPTECAITMSFQGDPESGGNARRKRGRLFLGPLDAGTASTGAGLVRVGAGATSAIAVAASAVIDSATPLGFQWIVFSPTTAGAPPWDETTLDAASTLVTQGWIDNAFDTQRRRGTDPTSRVTFPV